MPTPVSAPAPDFATPSRRLLLGGAAVWLAGALAGCSGPARRRRAGWAQPGGRPWLALDPAGREASVAQAMLLLNTPYRYGGNTPEGGFDCSGLVHYVYRQISPPGQRLPRSTAEWASASHPQQGQPRRGDLVFFNTSGQPFSHMGIYVGDGHFVHAPSSGGTVRQASITSRYFGPRYQGARSVFA